MLRLFTDFKSPAAYLAMKPTLALAERHGLVIDYLPFRTQQWPVPAQRPGETQGESHRRVRALSRRDIHLKYAAIQNIPMTFSDEPGKTDLALAALLFTQPAPQAFIEAAFRVYWEDHEDLNDLGVVSSLLKITGYDSDGFTAARYLDDLDEVQTTAEDFGIIDAPAYVINNEIFIGREHLPWLEELITSALAGRADNI